MGELTKKIKKGVQEVPIEFGRLLGKRYPAFVTEAKTAPLRDEVPAFMFHTARGDLFAEQLDYLKANGYRTLGLETFLSYLKGEAHLEGPSVVLTFDDGDVSWYRIAYPLLKRYGFHAIGFIVPHYIREDRNEDSKSRWLSWPEVIEMDQSGVFDIQSHTYSHKRIFSAPDLMGFYHPGFSHNGLRLDVPWVAEGGLDTNHLKWGTPIYRGTSRMEAHPRFIGGAEVRAACTAWVEARGGERFFESQAWEKALRRFYREAERKNHFDAIYESKADQEGRILDELIRAKTVLEERLNKPVASLCYPWGAGSGLAVTLSKKAGYTSNFWVTVEARRTNRKGDTPYYITRLKDDYLFRLPGSARKSLLNIFKMKARRRAETMDLY